MILPKEKEDGERAPQDKEGGRRGQQDIRERESVDGRTRGINGDAGKGDEKERERN